MNGRGSTHQAEPWRDPSARPTGHGRRLLTLKIPLAYVLLVAALVGAVFVVVLVAREPVDLGRAVDDAVEAAVWLTVCNETVDRREINPRTAELDLQKAWKT